MSQEGYKMRIQRTLSIEKGTRGDFSKGQLEFRGVEEVGAFLGKGNNMKLT